MDRIEKQLSDYLKRMNFIYMNQEINTECIKDYKGFSILGEFFGPFERGNKYKLRIFESKPLIDCNILKILSNGFFTNVDIQRYAISERDNQQIALVENPFFLNKIRESKVFFKKDIESGKKPRADLDRYSSHSINLIDSRLLKLLRLARSELSLDDNRRLSKSEKYLYTRIFNLIKIWRSFFLK